MAIKVPGEILDSMVLSHTYPNISVFSVQCASKIPRPTSSFPPGWYRELNQNFLLFRQQAENL